MMPGRLDVSNAFSTYNIFSLSGCKPILSRGRSVYTNLLTVVTSGERVEGESGKVCEGRLPNFVLLYIWFEPFFNKYAFLY